MNDRHLTVPYTTDGAWWVHRWSRRRGQGDQRVADLCHTLVSGPHWPATGANFSWGVRRTTGTPPRGRMPRGGENRRAG